MFVFKSKHNVTKLTTYFQYCIHDITSSKSLIQKQLFFMYGHLLDFENAYERSVIKIFFRITIQIYSPKVVKLSSHQKFYKIVELSPRKYTKTLSSLFLVMRRSLSR